MASLAYLKGLNKNTFVTCSLQMIKLAHLNSLNL